MRHPLEYESRDERRPCPFCRSTATISGDLVSATGAVEFVPHNLNALARTFDRAGVLITRTPMACSDCGALSSAIDTPKLREVLARRTNNGVA
jgi:hypothetical protein